MTHLDIDTEAIGKRNLKLLLPKPGTITVAPSAVGQYEQMVGVGIFGRANCLPPTSDRGHGKFGGVTACAQVDKSLIAGKIINSVRDGDPFCIGWKIMVKHRNGLLVPLSSGLMKWSDQLAAFGINTDHRHAIGSVMFDPGADVAKLLIALTGRRWISQSRLKAFQVFSKGEIHFFKQPAHRVGRNTDAHAFEFAGDFGGGPFDSGECLAYVDLSTAVPRVRR